MKLYAVAEAVKEAVGGNVIEVNINSHPGRYLRWVIAQCFSLKIVRDFSAGKSFKNIILKRILKATDIPNKLEADIVISSLGYHIAANVLIASSLNAKAIHIGPLAKRWKKYFHMNLILPTEKKIRHDYTLALDVLPTRIRLKEPDKSQTDSITVLIGGDTRANNYFFSRKDWSDIGAALEHLGVLNQHNWMITTSPRTSCENESILKPYINKIVTQNTSSEVVFYGEEPADVVSKYLYKSSIAIVTEDSRSMISDAVAAGLKTVVIRPDEAKPKKKHDEHIKYLEANNYIMRLTISQFLEVAAQGKLADFVSNLNPVSECWSNRFKEHFFSHVSS